MGSIADLFVRILPDVKGFGAKLRSGVEGNAADAGKKTGASFGQSFVAGVGSVIAAGAIAKFFKEAFNEAQEAAKTTAATAAAIKATGSAAHVTALQVSQYADELSNIAGIDDEVIAGGENLLLTFKNVRNEAGKGNDIFKQATAAALDMSVALGKDLNSSITVVGKALNAPVEGLTALSKIGVRFTAEQKERIQGFVDEGRVMDAQKVILDELTGRFKGAAEAAATPADKARVAWANFQEMIGNRLLPTLNEVLNWGVRNQSWLVPFVTSVGKLAAVIATVVVAMKAWNTVQNVLGIGLDTTASKARRAAVGITGLLVAVQLVGAALHKDINPQIDALAKDLEVFGRTGQASSELLRVLGGDVDNLGDALANLRDGNFLTDIGDAIADFADFGPIVEGKERIQALDTALSQLVQSGHADAAAAAFKKIWEEAQRQNVDLSALQAAFPQYIAAAQHTTTANTELAKATKSAADAGDDLISTWKELHGTMLSADEAMLEATDAVNDVKEAFKSGGKAVAGNSQAVLENRIAMERAAQAAVEAAAAYVRNGGSAAEAANIVQRFKDQAVAATGATGANANAVRALADQLFRIPANVTSNVLITTTKRTIYEESTVQHQRRGGGPADFADGGIVKFFAAGGLENHIAQIMRPGTMRVWNEPEAGGEAYIPFAQGKRRQSTEILSRVAREFGYHLAPTPGGDGTGGGTGPAGWSRVEALLAKILVAVGRVAPGVGQEINGMGTAIRTAGRAR